MYSSEDTKCFDEIDKREGVGRSCGEISGVRFW